MTRSTRRDWTRRPDPFLTEWFGGIDVYLFDQLLRGRLARGMRVLDTGCGAGRNLVYFLKAGYRVAGVDRDEAAVEAARALAARLAPQHPRDAFRVEEAGAMSFDDASFDAVLCNAVLHFAADEAEFHRITRELWRVLAPGGVLFARLASSIGIEDRVRPLAGRVCAIPDGTERFLVDEPFLLDETEALGGVLLDPIKTVNVQGQRCMTTWCLGKPG